MDQRKKAKLMGLRPYVHGLDFFIINKKNNLLSIFFIKKKCLMTCPISNHRKGDSKIWLGFFGFKKLFCNIFLSKKIY
jgi:hypothetical protein